MRFVTQLLQLRTQKQICGEKWTGSERDWRPSWSCDAVTSTPAPLTPYQPARPTLLIEPAASQSPAEIDCAAVSITSDSYTSLLPPPSSAVSSSLAQAPAGYLFVMGFFHLSPSSSSLQPESLSAWMEAPFYSPRIYGLLTRCLREQAASRGQKLLCAASSSLNLVQMNRILFRNMF